MKKLCVVVCMLMLVLVGCDNNDNVLIVVKKDVFFEVIKAVFLENVSLVKFFVLER